MWDVVWTDPERKSRKEHRDRKADKNSKKPRSDPVFNAPRSISSRSSTSASSFNGAFLAVSPGRKRAQRNLVPPSPTLSSVPTSPTSLTSTHLDDGASIFSVGSESTPTISNYSPPSIHEKYLHPERPDFVRSISSLSARVEAYIDSSDTINASYLAPPRTALQIPQIVERVALEPHSLVQTLSDDSFITRSTEVTTTTRSSGDTSMAISTEVTITAQSDSKKPERPMSPSTQSQPSGALKILRRVTSSNSSLRQEPRDAWQPPNAWVCKPVSESSPSATEDNISASIEDSSSSDSSSGFSLNLDSLRQELEHLSVENNHVRLLRLTRVWETLSGSPRRDLNVEQIQWILSALNNMNGGRHLSASGHASEDSLPNRTSKILALFESPAVTSYLAGVHSEKQVYHLSSSPLSHTLFPNIHPVSVPGRTVSAFPLAPALFEAIYSFRLPAVVASQEIPSVLKNVHRCLQPGGSFHLIVIDPLPLVSSLGPLLRSWIEQHLLINLETSFCCTNPSRLMPIWLKNASLQVDGSRTLVTKFSAISSDEEQLIDAISVDGEEKVIDQELRNMIGRMAWMEIWKDYITADQWWWEDSSIVEECTKLGTAWEYHEIIASKC